MATALIPFHDYGLSAFTFCPGEPINPLLVQQDTEGCHTHMEIEMIYVERGEVLFEHTGRHLIITEGELAVFWAGLPHQAVASDTVTAFHVAQIPVVCVLSWIGHTGAMAGFLKGEVRISRSSARDRACDLGLFSRWTEDLMSGDPLLIAPAELEVQAMLRRFLRDSTAPVELSRVPRSDRASADLAARTIRYVTRRFMEPLSVEEIAQHVGLHHDHVMSTFRRTCGITLWDYVTRLRVSEAQRLLATTDMPILSICHRAGFSSTSRMYEAFHRVRGITPAEYRKRAS